MKSSKRIANNPPADEPPTKIARFSLALSRRLETEDPEYSEQIETWAKQHAPTGVAEAVRITETTALEEIEFWQKTPAKHRQPPLSATPILCFDTESDWIWDPALSPKSFSLDYLDGPLGYRIARAESDSSPLRKSLPKSRDTTNKIVWDLCGGWRVDALLMAHWGFEVLSLEKSPWVHLFSERALARAQIVVQKELALKTICQDAIEFFDSHALIKPDLPSIIYIDPMYPETDSKALNQIEMRFLHELSSSEDIAAELLEKSLPIALDRVIIKRPVKAPELERKPNFKVEQGSTRYDIYLAQK